jgi:hypothetical protein
MKRIAFLLVSITAAVLPASAAAQGATSGVRPDDRATHGPGAIASTNLEHAVRPDDRAWRGLGPEPIRVAVVGAVARPDDRANHGVGALTTSLTRPVRPDDRAWRGIGPEPTVVPIDSPTVTVDRFDWLDAGVGAAGALGLALLLAGASVFAVRRHTAAPVT